MAGQANNKVHDEWYEEPLPKPPVPSLEHTLNRYLEFAEVVCEPGSLSKTKSAVKSFQQNENQYQEQLEKIAETSYNWATKFWLPAFYLKDRNPLPTNASPAYVLPLRNFKDNDDFFNYCAWLIRGLFEYKLRVDRKEIPREVTRNGVRMCMEQYERLFHCYREPRTSEDFLDYKPPNKKGVKPLDDHILVMCRNQAFILYTLSDDEQVLPFSEIKNQLLKIDVLSQKNSLDAIVPIGAASAGYRETAALFWENFRKVPENEKGFQLVKYAPFVICLDIFQNEQNRLKCLSKADRGMHVLAGFDHENFNFNRWDDATLQIVISNNGAQGICLEHSVAEGVVLFNMFDNVLAEIEKKLKEKQITSTENRYSPLALNWHYDSTTFELLNKEIADFYSYTKELQLDAFEFHNFGKNYIKSKSVSPDAFVQISMQLAAYRVFGKLVSTYETASLRRFAGGRVDNNRAATPEALSWVKAMVDPSVSKETKRDLFYKAAAKHVLIIRENTSGLGIDNHLTALYELAKIEVENGKRNSLPEMFEDPTWTQFMQFPLSTSQSTQNPIFSDRYANYGPVCKNGYGVPYDIQQNSLNFTVSSHKSCTLTDRKGFGKAIREALLDIQNVLD